MGGQRLVWSLLSATLQAFVVVVVAAAAAAAVVVVVVVVVVVAGPPLMAWALQPPALASSLHCYSASFSPLDHELSF